MTLTLVVVAAAIAFLLGAAVASWSRRAGEARRAAAAKRRHAELEERVSALRAELDSMDRILSTMHEGVLLFDPSGKTTFANRAAEQMLGPRPGSVSTLLPLGLREAAADAAASAASASAEVEVGSPTRYLRGSAIPVGRDGSVLLVIRDVTEARRVESIRRDFVANASHELKTPAASIQAAAETIRTAVGDDPTVVPRFAAQLEREASRLSRIVNDLLDLSRLESGGELEGPVALDAVLAEEVERFTPIAAAAGVELSVSIAEVPKVRGSGRDLGLLVRNLVDNAVRYTPSGGRVEIWLKADRAQIVLAVADTGPGIPARDLDRIFERFYRVDRARSRGTGGTGLGLSIVKHVVENHGGSVSVRSELGRGTRFEVRLPVPLDS